MEKDSFTLPGHLRIPYQEENLNSGKILFFFSGTVGSSTSTTQRIYPDSLFRKCCLVIAFKWYPLGWSSKSFSLHTSPGKSWFLCLIHYRQPFPFWKHHAPPAPGPLYFLFHSQVLLQLWPSALILPSAIQPKCFPSESLSKPLKEYS